MCAEGSSGALGGVGLWDLAFICFRLCGAVPKVRAACGGLHTPQHTEACSVPVGLQDAGAARGCTVEKLFDSAEVGQGFADTPSLVTLCFMSSERWWVTQESVDSSVACHRPGSAALVSSSVFAVCRACLHANV